MGSDGKEDDSWEEVRKSDGNEGMVARREER